MVLSETESYIQDKTWKELEIAVNSGKKFSYTSFDVTEKIAKQHTQRLRRAGYCTYYTYGCPKYYIDVNGYLVVESPIEIFWMTSLPSISYNEFNTILMYSVFFMLFSIFMFFIGSLICSVISASFSLAIFAVNYVVLNINKKNCKKWKGPINEN